MTPTFPSHCIAGRLLGLPLALLASMAPALSQSQTLTHGPHRMEIMLERRDGNAWHVVDPGLVFAPGDRVRFRFRTNFDGYLFVMNHSTSGKYEQLFPHAETGRENQIAAGREYLIPATQTYFRVAGPPGHEIVYWIVTPTELTESQGSAPEYIPLPPPPPRDKRNPQNLVPRCDDALFRARGDCIDTSAGPKGVARGEALPENLTGMANQAPRDLLFMRQKNTAVVASPAPLEGPVIYEFHLAHK